MSKSLLKMFLKRFSGLLALIAVGVFASIASGDFKSLLSILDSSQVILIPLIVLIIIVWNRAKIRGYIGEKAVSRNLSKLDEAKFKIINNIMLNINGKTSQIDHLIVSTYGIFVIETKNYSGWITGREYDDYWTQTIYKRKEKLYNPIRQNYAHIKALQDVLKEYSNLEYYSIVAFTKQADLKVQTSTDVVYTSEIVQTIQKYCAVETLPNQQMDEICNALVSRNIDSRRHRKEHIASIQTMKTETQNKIKNDICPKCGGSLVTRNGKYGQFKGCSGYPKCKYVLK